jgi:hypothetical protein
MRLDSCGAWPYPIHVQRIFSRCFKWIVKDTEMKFYPPIYPGDSILQPGTVPGGDLEPELVRTASKLAFVRSNISADRKPEAKIDLIEIEERARAARSAWVGAQLKSLYAALARKFEQVARDRLQRELTASNRVCPS